MISAAQRGDLSTLRAMPNAEEVRAARDKYGSSPCHWAAGEGHLEVLRFLVNEIGLDPDCEA